MTTEQLINICSIVFCIAAVASALFGVFHVIYGPKIVPRFRFAGFWRRLGAGIIDCFLLYLSGLIPTVIALFAYEHWFSELSGIHINTLELAAIFVMSVVAFLPVGFWVYCAAMESSAHQATIGKLLFRLRVVDINGERVSFWRATARHFAKIPTIMSFFVGFFMVGWAKEKQALHDKISGCLVVCAIKKPE